MFGNIGKIMQLVSDMKTKMPEMKAKLEASTYTAQAGNGVVSVTVNGKLKLVDLTIDPTVEIAMLEDFIKAAVSTAQAQATEAAEEAMKELTGGMDLPPGLI